MTYICQYNIEVQSLLLKALTMTFLFWMWNKKTLTLSASKSPFLCQNPLTGVGTRPLGT